MNGVAVVAGESDAVASEPAVRSPASALGRIVGLVCVGLSAVVSAWLLLALFTMIRAAATGAAG